MKTKSEYIDIGFLAAIGILLVLAFKDLILGEFILPITTYVGLFVWIAVVAYKIFKPTKSTFLIIWMLIVATFNVISFDSQLASFGTTAPIRYNGYTIGMPGVNPFLLLFLLIYFVLNTTVSKALYRKLFKPSYEEAASTYQKHFDFYYDKFVGSSAEEFSNVIKMFKDYPPEAQEAIEKIREERNIQIGN